MNRIKIILAAFALVAAGTVSAQTLTDVNAKFTEAATAMQAKDFNKAIPLFEQVIDEGLDIEGAESLVAGAKKYLPQAVFVSGGMAFQQDKLDVALANFTKAADLAELYGEVGILTNARSWIGKTVMKQGADAFNNKDYAAAAAIFQKGYDANPNDMDVALNLAMSYSELKEYDKGNEVYNGIIALEGQDPRFDEAVATAKEQFTNYNMFRASECAQNKDYAGALTAADDVLSVIPNSPEASMLRLQTFNSQKDYNRVIEFGDATAALQTDPEQQSSANFLVGAAFQNKENYAKAIEYYKKVTAGANAETAKAQITELAKLNK